jgi:hypothetical protein
MVNYTDTPDLNGVKYTEEIGSLASNRQNIEIEELWDYVHKCENATPCYTLNILKQKTS